MKILNQTIIPNNMAINKIISNKIKGVKHKAKITIKNNSIFTNINNFKCQLDKFIFSL